MKHKLIPFIVILLLSILASACYPYVNNPSLSNWPKYIPADMLPVSFAGISPPAPESCQIHAVDLLGAWVTANAPETDPFPFTDASGKQCQGTFT